MPILRGSSLANKDIDAHTYSNTKVVVRLSASRAQVSLLLCNIAGLA